MSVAVPIARANESMNASVCRSLARYLRLPPDSIIVPRNADKYHAPDERNRSAEVLDEVFELMWRLNRAGLADRTLGNTAHRDGCLSTVLDRTISSVAERVAGRPVHHVELGPEPAKTCTILRGLADAGVDVRSYTAVDVNPVSERIMRENLAGLVDGSSFSFVRSLFEELPRLPDRPDECHLVTMLGFEEGNDHPRAVRALLGNLLRPGDIFLSEMQLLPKIDWSPIYAFYRSDSMRRFSRLTLERTFGDVESEFGFYLVPVPLDPAGIDTMVAVIAETVVDRDPDHGGEVLVTNYCIKYSDEEYRATREAAGDLRVVDQHLTADGSIAFQISVRVRGGP